MALYGTRLAVLVYPENPFGGRVSPLPGVRLEAALGSLCGDLRQRAEQKLWHGCRKLALAWFGADQSLAAESDFYAQTFHDIPVLFGEHAITVHYHLEAFVLLARASMDVTAGAFGLLLGAPFPSGRYDSFNDLVKTILKVMPESALGQYFVDISSQSTSWLTVLTSLGDRRGLRDKLAHQIEFPIEYVPVSEHSDRERPLVILSKDVALPLEEFVEMVRAGMIAGFLRLEDACLASLQSVP
ncbi:MAG: hypothetical protein JWL95_3040 [Gemmatimonadetes bacterium]|nr:hypothetical protein [Gemmatimonadota bacterium]